MKLISLSDKTYELLAGIVSGFNAYRRDRSPFADPWFLSRVKTLKQHRLVIHTYDPAKPRREPYRATPLGRALVDFVTRWKLAPKNRVTRSKKRRIRR